MISSTRAAAIITRKLALSTLLCCLGCVGSIEDLSVRAGEPDSGPDIGDPDASTAPGTPDAAPPTPPDAAPPTPPDAAPPPYPSGPYGYSVGSTITNLSWSGYVDSSADSDHNPFNEPARTVTLEEFFVGRDPGARIIIINSSAGWCSYCQQEMPELEELYNDYSAGGARVITTLFENASYGAADVAFARSWGEAFGLTFATVADPSKKVGAYYTQDLVPMNMFIDASTMTIVEIYHGYDVSHMRQVVQAYVD